MVIREQANEPMPLLDLTTEEGRRQWLKGELERPKCCEECSLWWRPVRDSTCGYCDNWAGIKLEAGSVCHPNMGKNKRGGQDAYRQHA